MCKAPCPALCGAVFGIESGIVGYGYYQVPVGYSIWSPVFKSMGAGAVDLTAIKPATTNLVDISGDGKVVIFKLSTTGAYGTSYGWIGSKGGWSSDGSTIIGKGVVTFSDGEGFAMNNSVKVLPATGAESTARTAVAAPITLFTSGEVDLVCKNEVPYGYSISGNATPVAIDLVDVYPTTLLGATISGDGKVVVFKLGTDGKYGTSYGWIGSQNGWSADGSTILTRGTVTFAPGEGYAMNNGVKVTAAGVESTARTASPSAIKMVLPVPVH